MRASHNPTATAKTIIDGFVHTGDIACRDEGWNIYIVDRLKELIKAKGFQVAPAELEGLLLQHPLLADAAVIGKPDERSGEVPVAFVVKKAVVAAAAAAASGTKPPVLPEVTEDDVKKFISSKVAEYKQLGPVIFVDAIPKSAAGKIFRRVLKEKLRAPTS
jgi:4-coumarate--CoA ligase